MPWVRRIRTLAKSVSAGLVKVMLVAWSVEVPSTPDTAAGAITSAAVETVVVAAVLVRPVLSMANTA